MAPRICRVAALLAPDPKSVSPVEREREERERERRERERREIESDRIGPILAWECGDTFVLLVIPPVYCTPISGNVMMVKKKQPHWRCRAP
jgi:hypothetical protein